MTRRAPAKLNLGLHVLRRRPDGYHDLETVFVALPWADTLTAAPAPPDAPGALTLVCTDPTVPADGTNLVLRAAHALRAHAGTTAGADLVLDKAIPHGAGLGGGSSDAAAALRLLADRWGLQVSPADLAGLAAGLGADVPFFLDPRPAVATGRGDRLTPLLADDGAPYRLPYALVVAVPDVRVATAEAYGLVAPRGADRTDLAAVVRSNDLHRWRRELVNDFEGPVVTRHPALGHVRDALTAAGAGYVAMSGSGSAFFGVFAADAEARGAAEALRYAGHAVWHGVAGADAA